MIVRILTDNQYRIPDESMAVISELDNRLLEATEKNDEQAFSTLLAQLIDFIKTNGTVVPHSELVPSNLVVPAPDMTLQEAQRILEQVEHSPIQA
jgi:2-phospho-L-lactate transferase/gluconeogenesis factor (CofD/UPF0052 family)